MNEFYLVGFIQAIFFVILILTKKRLELKDFILSAYVLILGLNLIFLYWHYTGYHSRNPLIILLDFTYWTFLGPLLYLYFDIVTSTKPRLTYKYLIHLLPFIIVMLGFSEYLTSGMKTNFFEYTSDSLLYTVGYYVFMYNSPLYYIIILVRLYSHKGKLRGYYASPKKVDLMWLNFLVHGFAIFLFFLLFSGMVLRSLNIDLKINFYQLNWIILVVYIFGIGFFGYKQKGIFSNEELVESEKVKQNKDEIYRKTGLREEEALIIKSKLEELMLREKPYLEYDITLPLLAKKLNTTSHKLSQIINESYKSNFFEFINKYRLTDLKAMLQNESMADTKIMALAYDCGFNSKSAFYSFFKKETSLTPTEYRNKYFHLTEV